MMKFPRKISRILGPLLAVASLVACQEVEEAEEEIIKPIVWTHAEAGDFEQVRRLSGVLQAARSAELSFLVGGRVQNVVVNLGDEVEAGGLLAELDEASYELNARAAEGSVQEARARFTEADNDYSRKQDLHSKGWISQSALDNARAAMDSAQSAVATAEARLALSDKDLADTALKAPYDGVITARLVEPSQQVTAGQTVLRIEGKEGLEVSVLAPENLVNVLRRDLPYDVRFPAYPGHTLKALVTEIGSEAENANAFPVTLLLQFQSADDREKLRAGMTAEIDFAFEGRGIDGYRGRTVRVPPTALVAGQGQAAYVFVYNEDTGTVNKRAVEVVGVIENEVLISKGLEPREIVAAAGVPYLTDGQRVRLLDVGIKTFN